MRYRYQTGGQEYVVQPTNDSLRHDELEASLQVEVEFLARINGGRGRMPKTRTVDVEELEPLIDFEAAKKLVRD